MQKPKIEGLWEKSGLAILCASCAIMAWISVGTLKEREANRIGTPHLVRAIRAANAVQMGDVAYVNVKRGEERTFVDVAIVAPYGRKYQVRVEGSTGKVLSVAVHKDGFSGETRMD